jgi:long-chain acyl-CoA synthetase
MVRFEDIRSLVASWADEPHMAMTFYEGRTCVDTLRYTELHDRVQAVAGHLWEVHGIRPGDRIAVLSPNRLDVPVLMLAAMSIAVAVVPLNPTAPPDDWRYILEHSKARACFAASELVPKLEGARLPVRSLDELAGVRGKAPACGSGAECPAVILYTSGTTGRPKGVVLAQRSLLANAWSMASNFALSRTTQLAVLPLYHAHALGFGLMTALTTGGHLVFADRFDPLAWPELVRTHEVTYTSVVPTLLPLLLQVKVKAARVPSLRAILVSSAPLTAALARDFTRRTGLRLVQGWGLSEYTNFACCMSPDDDLVVEHDVPSVGRPLPGTEVQIIDGELCVRGHSTMLSYLEDREASARVIDSDGWLHTGDQGVSIDGRFFITGRLKEIIIRDGEKHSPLALERIITAAVPELAGRIAVVGFPHTVHGEEVGAYIESEIASDEVRSRLAAALDAMGKDQRPKIVLIGAGPIPRTHTGKVQRRKLQPLFESHAACRGPTKLVSV